MTKKLEIGSLRKLRHVSNCALVLGLLLEPLYGNALAMGQNLTSSQAKPTYSETIAIHPAAQLSQQVVLRIRYVLDCQSDRYQMVPGEVSFEGRTIRFDLFTARNETSLLLGNPAAAGAATISLMSGTDCTAKALNLEVERISAQSQLSDADLAMIHSPFLNVRPDQVGNRLTDLPILLAYSMMPSEIQGGKKLRYTIFFTDEDSESDAAGTDFQMARYGRRTDIEWIYEIELDQNNNVVKRQYQGGLVSDGPLEGIGHADHPFLGQFVDGQHPVLYNVANHNVFSDKPLKEMEKLPLVGYELVPSEKIERHSAREVVMTRNPWMYKVSDVELAREGKLGAPSTQYLYASVAGKLSGSVSAVVVLGDRTEFTGNEGHGNLDRLGEDLWGQQAFVAIPMNESVLERIETSGVHGTIYFADAAEHAPEASTTNTIFQPSELKLFRIVKDDSNSYRYEDISSKFNCQYSNLETFCRF